MFLVLDDDGLYDQDRPYEYKFSTLEKCYEFLRTQINERYQFRLIESKVPDTWYVEIASKQAKPKWYKSLFWRVKRIN